MHQPRSSKQKRCINHDHQSKSISGASVYHQRYSCISPVRYSSISTARREKIAKTLRVDTAVSTARAVCQQQSKPKARALLDDTALSTWALYQPRSPNQMHLWQSCISPARYSCISPARYSCISTARKETKAKALLDDTAVSNKAVYQPRELYVNSNQKPQREHF